MKYYVFTSSLPPRVISVEGNDIKELFRDKSIDSTLEEQKRIKEEIKQKFWIEINDPEDGFGIKSVFDKDAFFLIKD